ncbi:membrane protein [Sporosarcina sp. NCCP-2716]|uniref:YoaK family protein n=1 Tax=Sporosarcina sp. NCCP-2716 TaxID=2943679 RepID=UPI0020426C46|nr:YoaK family protein [Sporosarcina sp. NCCP-2716]GKV70320.1 membrane protein [Sporosarcina sp. NCCP-2716]
MEQDHIHAVRITTFLTIGAAFLMGFIDAYTFTELKHVFVSAQTGNMVTFGVKLVTGAPFEGIPNVMSLVGFMGGAFMGEVLLARYKERGLRKYRIFLYVQAVLLLLLAVTQPYLHLSVAVFVLGWLSGYALTTFRKIGSTAVNNGIMTGNARNMMSSLYKLLFEKDPQAKTELLHLGTGIVTFVAGVGAGAFVTSIEPAAVLWAAFAFVMLSISVLFVYRWH